MGFRIQELLLRFLRVPSLQPVLLTALLLHRRWLRSLIRPGLLLWSLRTVLPGRILSNLRLLQWIAQQRLHPLLLPRLRSPLFQFCRHWILQTHRLQWLRDRQTQHLHCQFLYLRLRFRFRRICRPVPGIVRYWFRNRF